MRANPWLSKALDSLTQPHYASTESESPCSLWLMPWRVQDEPLNLCLAQPLVVPTPVQWMHIATPSNSSLPNETFFVEKDFSTQTLVNPTAAGRVPTQCRVSQHHV